VVPKVDVLVSTVFQSVPGSQIAASFTYNKDDITWNTDERGPGDGALLVADQRHGLSRHRAQPDDGQHSAAPRQRDDGRADDDLRPEAGEEHPLQEQARHGRCRHLQLPQLRRDQQLQRHDHRQLRERRLDAGDDNPATTANEGTSG
jgi:hypothetical protein